MKNIGFDIKRSKKSYIQGKEQFIVVFDQRVYLRAVGEEGAYVLMTATASEDGGKIFSCSNQDLLINAAVKVINDMGYGDRYSIKHDHLNRRYFEIDSFEYLSDVHRFTEMLFKNLDVLFDASDDVESEERVSSH